MLPDNSNNVPADPIANQHRLYFVVFALLWQVVMVVLYAVFGDYASIAQV